MDLPLSGKIEALLGLTLSSFQKARIDYAAKTSVFYTTNKQVLAVGSIVKHLEETRGKEHAKRCIKLAETSPRSLIEIIQMTELELAALENGLSATKACLIP